MSGVGELRPWLHVITWPVPPEYSPPSALQPPTGCQRPRLTDVTEESGAPGAHLPALSIATASQLWPTLKSRAIHDPN